MNTKSNKQFRKIHYGIALAGVFLCLGFGISGSTAALAQEAATSTYQIYLPLVLRGFPPPVLQTLTVSNSGTGTGTVTSQPAGINCGSSCSYDFPDDTVVTLTAAASTGSSFLVWSGGGCDGRGAPTCQVTMDSARSVTATFNQVSYALEVYKDGTGSGTVTSSPPGIDCGLPETCSSAFAYNTVVTLTAEASATPPSTFGGWSEDCSGTGTCTVTMSMYHSVTATFDTTGGGIVNGSFEGGSTSWIENSGSGIPIIRHRDDLLVSPHNGDYAAWFVLYSGETSYIKQNVTIPASAHHLVYWQWIVSDDPCDYSGMAEVFIKDTRVDFYDLCTVTSTQGWVSHSIDLTDYAGQSVWLRIGVIAVGYNFSNLYIDDVSLEASAP